MTILVSSAPVIGLLAIPFIALIVDLSPFAIAGSGRTSDPDGDIAPVQDFTVLVPIYGNVRYLENIDYLREYGDKVMLCTTSGESAEFYEALRNIADDNGLNVYVADDCPPASGGRRQTGGVTRDSVVREALAQVHTTYVVCVDADTRTERPASGNGRRIGIPWP